MFKGDKIKLITLHKYIRIHFEFYDTEIDYRIIGIICYGHWNIGYQELVHGQTVEHRPLKMETTIERHPDKLIEFWLIDQNR